MARTRHSDIGNLPPRSESFLRMLELEKQYKMQRIQDNPPAANSLPGLTSAPALSSQPATAPVPVVAPASAPAPAPASRARRGSAYPPLSHQDQMLKAMNRSSTLPSLSISIPPSPAQDPLPKINTPTQEPRPAKEERTKTVTFSDPDEEESELSDQSSICQSPSWEGWNKRTKRPDKSNAKQSSKEEQTDKQARKKGNKLSKAPPQNPIPTSNGRSASAPQLNTPKVDMAATTMVATTMSQPVRYETATQAQVSQSKAYPPSAAKPKTKKTIFGFKLQNGSSGGGKKPFEGATESAQSGKEKSSSANSTRKHHSIGPGVDHGSLGLLHSANDPSNRSQSSLDKRPPMVRPPSSSSNHARSQSLLSSTLNRLRGPSYLYHRPAEKRHSNPPVVGSESPRPSVQSEDRPNSSGRPIPTPPTTVLPRKAKHKSTVSDIANISTDRSREHRPFKLRDPNNDCDSPEPPEVRPRYNEVATTQTHGRDATSKKRDEGAQNPAGLQRNQQTQGGLGPRHTDDHRTESSPKPSQHRTRHDSPAEKSRRVQRPADSPEPVKHDFVSSGQDEEYSSAQEHLSDHGPPAHRRRRKQDKQEDTEVSTSTTRPTSRGRESSPFQKSNNSKDQLTSSNQGETGKSVASNHDAKPSITRINLTTKVPKTEQDEDKLRLPIYPLRPKKSTDYFSFITESYAPPSLELRSPLENLLQTLSQHSLAQAEAPKQVDEADKPQRPSSRQATLLGSPAAPATPETRTETPKAKVGSGLVRSQEPRESPAAPAHIPDHELPPFEPLTVPSKATKTSNDSITESTSARQPRQQETSRTASERSSSSTFGDVPPSPSSMTTPDSSRPHSNKSRPPSHLDLCRTVVPGSASDEKTKPRSFPLTSRDRSSSRSRPTSKDADAADDSWSRSALPIDLENYSSVSLSGPDALTSTPVLISTPTSMTFADALKEEIAEELSSRGSHTDAISNRAQSALDLPSTSFLPPLKHQSLNPKKNTSKLSATATTAPSSPLSEHPEEHLRPALKKSRTSIGTPQDASVLVSTGAAYLQEARKTVNGASAPASSRALRPQFPHRNSAVSSKGGASSSSASGRAEPMAKMLVECCSCHFFHDMPARVYECMAKPDSVVEDKTLGVSAAITTMVKCPWCSHGMTTQCCAGYAAVVYLKEKLHGK